MTDSDEISVWLAAGILRGCNYEIEAMSLEALAEDAPQGDLSAALEASQKSDQRGGALGLEIIGVVIVPVLVEAVKQFWSEYQKELMTNLGKTAAAATATHFKKWFVNTSENEQQRTVAHLTQTIRDVGKARNLKQEDIDALIAATTPEKLSGTLNAT